MLSKERRGWYRITDNGREVDARNLLEYSENDLREWSTWTLYLEELAERRRRGDGGSASRAPGSVLDQEIADPIALAKQLVREANDGVETELRAALQGSSPEFFERAVLEVLWAMGYGGGQGEKEHLGRTNDGGIDGVIRQDPLGLQKVYVQAKRYADGNTVGSPEINGFWGALARRGADRGVFITSSTFSPAAKDAAAQFGGKIVLIDGIRLTSLMLRHGVGVEARESFTVFEVNTDFFED